MSDATPECSEAGGPTYGLLLHALAESIRATRILEIGTGWGHSAAAFCRSMQARGGTLYSIDPHNRLTDANREACVGSGVICQWMRQRSHESAPAGLFDLCYIDGDPRDARADFDRFYDKVRPGGLMVLDGYGGQPGPTDAVDTLSAVYPFVTLPYHDVYQFAVHRKVERGAAKGGYHARCDGCDRSAILPSWVAIDTWADMHIAKTQHTVTVFAEPRNLRYQKKRPQ